MAEPTNLGPNGHAQIEVVPIYCSVHWVGEDGELSPVTKATDIPPGFNPTAEDEEGAAMGLWLLDFLPVGPFDLYHVALRIVDEEGREIQIEAEGA